MPKSDPRCRPRTLARALPRDVPLPLEQLSPHATQAWNGSECLEKLFEPSGKAIGGDGQRLAYNIIFMDVCMPEMDGIETTRTLLRDISPNAAVIGLTAHVQDEDRDLCLAAGMKDFLAKPISIEELNHSLSIHTKS